RQNWEASAAFTQTLDARLSVTSLQITLRAHVVVHLMQVVLQLLAIEYVLFTKAREQSRFLDVLHLISQLAALENLAPFEANLKYAHARALGDLESDGDRGSRNLLFAFRDGRIGMALGCQQFLQHANRVVH